MQPCDESPFGAHLVKSPCNWRWHIGSGPLKPGRGRIPGTSAIALLWRCTTGGMSGAVEMAMVRAQAAPTRILPVDIFGGTSRNLVLSEAWS